MRIDFGSLDSSASGTTGKRTVGLWAPSSLSLGRWKKMLVFLLFVLRSSLMRDCYVWGRVQKGGAWDGLFLKLQPRRIPRGRKMCLYMDKLYNAFSVVSSQDYTLEMRHKGKMSRL